ncbi:MAG: ParA family protein [bacterium]
MRYKTKIISIVNQKGGVGKTTTACNLAYSLTEFSRKVLLLDMDSQANLSHTLAFKEDIKDNTTFELLTGQKKLTELIQESRIKGIDIIPAKINLANVEKKTSDIENRDFILKNSIEEVRSKLEYDFIIIDCPPSLSIITVNSLFASDSILIPTEPSIYSTNGLSQLLDIVAMVRKKSSLDKSSLDIEGVLLTRVDSRTNIADEFEKELRQLFGNKIFDTIIHQNVAVAEAQKDQLPVGLYDEQARSSKEYINLAKEVIANE